MGTCVVRSIETIAVGDEVCITYLTDEQMLLPSSERREQLQRKWEFVCRCERCSADADDTRAFPCGVQECLGVCHVLQNGTSVGGCSECATVMSAPDFDATLSKESALHHTLGTLNTVSQLEVLMSLRMTCWPLSHFIHCISSRGVSPWLDCVCSPSSAGGEMLVKSWTVS